MKQDMSIEPSVFELKGSVLTIMVLHVKETDANLLYPQLVKKIGQGRSFFTNAPVLIDLTGVEEMQQLTLDCRLLAETLRGLSLVPVAVRGAAAGLTEQILAAGMGLLPAIKGERTAAVPEYQPQAKAAEESAVKATNTTQLPEPALPEPAPPGKNSSVEVPTRVISQPVRSGQQILAPNGDLVILSSVNAGAEVLAAGNIHVYGALRGRALAGINGDTSACVFSMQCNPELVAVAGEYVVNELLDKEVMNRSVMISLAKGANGGLKFTAIGPQNQDRS